VSGARYEAEVTVTVSGEETDLLFRGFVNVVPSRSRGAVAEPDGGFEYFWPETGCWRTLCALGLSAREEEKAIDAVCEAALEDDGGGEEYEPEEWD